MPWDNVLAVAALQGLVGVGILIALWPGEPHGRRLLRRWGVTDPSEVDVSEAVRYLKRRRFVYPWLFMLLPLASGAVGLGEEFWWTIVWTLLLGGLLGELLALRPATSGPRQAILVRRTLTDLVPLWALVLLALAVGGGLVRYAIDGRWAAFGAVAGCGIAVAVVLVLTVRRPAAGDPVVDLVFRARSARVATGLAIGIPGSLLEPKMTAPGALLFGLGLVGLLAMVSPRRDLVAAPG